jgi:hypothetical protein
MLSNVSTNTAVAIFRMNVYGVEVIHPEDGNCGVCRNVGKPSTFDVPYP